MTPAVIAFVAATLIAGRVVLARQAVEAAAFEAARAASLSRDAGTATVQAQLVAAGSLADQSIHCVTLRIDVDTSQFSVAVGQPASVTVRVSCLVRLADVALPGMPGDTEVTASFASPLDQYRSRS